VCTEKPDFQQGQQQTDVLEALLLQRWVWSNIEHGQENEGVRWYGVGLHHATVEPELRGILL
jgi:hypothetical protein